MSGRGRGRGRGAARGGSRGRGGGRGGATARSTEPREEKPQGPIIRLHEIPFVVLSPHELKQAKIQILNTVSSSLIKEPRFNEGESVTNIIKQLVVKIGFYEPEFLLKLALYSRDELNIRSTSNYLVALCTNLKQCQPFLKKYFKAIVRLPSDWLDIAATFEMLPDKYLTGNALPTALRKAMVEKFPDFDVYQLGKYNKEKSIKKKAKKLKEKIKSGEAKAPTTPQKPTLTIKQMIRQLHISEPPYNVMCILGKKYPLTEDEFKKDKLPGEFEPLKSGKRMKLPTPETWETLLSEKGNKASTWEELIEHQKLPFMAMIRNLRNLIFTGVHPKYHRWVMNKLSNEITVSMSRQFPTQFFSAYSAIPKDMADFKEKLQEMNKPKETKSKDAAAATTKKRAKKNPIVPAYLPSDSLFQQYREAIDNAVKLATKCNVKPIKGSTVVFCNVNPNDMSSDCSSAKGIGALKKLDEVGILLGLMCKYVCEECDFRIFAMISESRDQKSHKSVDLIDGTILDNMKVVMDVVQSEFTGVSQSSITVFPYDYIEDLILSKKKIDNLIVLSNSIISSGRNEMQHNGSTISNILDKYRKEINPNLLYVSVDLSGKGVGVQSSESSISTHPNDVLISGFSDSILRFIAERGDSQLQYVENIDKSKGLQDDTTKVSDSYLDQIDMQNQSSGAPQSADATIAEEEQEASKAWRTARVFISSTFVDFHSERDVLTRYVFPELRERAKKKNINIVEVDLRWGVSEEETQMNRTIRICLEEVDRCRPFFLSLLGHRYGWTPDNYINGLPDEDRFNWLKEYPSGRSITELEIQHAYFNNNDNKNMNCLFYFRDSSFKKNVPTEYVDKFFSPDMDSQIKMDDLKKKIISSNANVFKYKCNWAGEYDGKPMVKGLESLRKRLLEDLWNAICNEFPDTDSNNDSDGSSMIHVDPMIIQKQYHHTFLSMHTRKFQHRKELDELSKLFKTNNVVVISGKEGTGKSALASVYIKSHYKNYPGTSIIYHFIGSAPGSIDIRQTLQRLCNEICKKFQLDEVIPDDYNDLCQTFASVIEQASFKGRILIVIDALDQLLKTNRAHSLDWLPFDKLGSAKVLLTALEGPIMEVIRRKKGNGGNKYKSGSKSGSNNNNNNIVELQIGALSQKERKDIIRETLMEYNKKLDERPMNDQMRVLLKKTDSDKPLYLIIACQELRLFGVYEQLTDKIKSLPQTISKLFEDVLIRLEQDHGKEMIRNVMSLIYCSRNGILESEMIELLRRKGKNEISLPIAIWSRLYSSISLLLKPLVLDNRLDFFHREVARSVHKRYMEFDQEQEIRSHRMLGEYFYQKADPEFDGSWKGLWNNDNIRSLSELPYHLSKGKLWKALEKTLCSLSFIQLKCSSGLTSDLINDYILATDDSIQWGKGNERPRENVIDFGSFVRSKSHILSHHPDLTYQEAANMPDFTATARIARSIGNPDGSLWFKYINKPQQSDPCKMTVKVTDDVTCCTIDPNGSIIAIATKDCMIRLFNIKTGLELSTLIGHSNWISSLSWSSDGSLIASSSADGSIRLWDSTLHIEVKQLKGHTRLVNVVQFSPDLKTICSASWDTTLRIWNNEGKTIHTIRSFSRPVSYCSYSSDSTKIVASCWDGTIKIFNVEDGNEIVSMIGHTKSVRCCKFSPSGKHIVSSSVDNTVRIWDSTAGKEIACLKSHSKPVNNVSYSNDGQKIVSGSDDNTIKIYDAILGKEMNTMSLENGYSNHVCYSYDSSLIASACSESYISIYKSDDLSIIGNLNGHTRCVNYCQFDPTSNNRLVSSSDDRTLIIWDLNSMKSSIVLKGHRDSVNHCCWSPDGNRIASASDDFTIRIWNSFTGSEELQLVGHTSVVRSVVWSPNGKWIASAGRDACLLWNANNGKLLGNFQGHLDWVNSVSFSPDSKKLVTGSWDFTLKVWDVSKAQVKVTMTGHSSAIASCKFTSDGKQVISASYDGTMKVWDSVVGSEVTTLIGHERRVNGLDISPNGDVVSCSDDSSIKIWDPLHGVELQTLVGHSNSISECLFTPDNNQVVSSSYDRTSKLWDLSINNREFIGHYKPINCLSLSKDGSLLSSSSSDCTVKIWDLKSGKCIRTIKDHKLPVRSCSISNDNKYIVTGSDDKTCLLIDISTGKVIHTLRGHNHSVTSVSFSSNGKQIVSGSWDKTVKVWDSSNGKIVYNLIGHNDWVSSVSFSPDDKYIVSGSYDNSCIIWQKGKQVRRLNGIDNWVTSLSISQDSKTVIASTYDSSIISWNINDGSEIFRIDNAHNNNSKITCCSFAANGKAILTGSHDGTVKAWSTKSQRMLAEFVCASPCVSLSASSRISIADEIGHIYLLSFQHGKSDAL